MAAADTPETVIAVLDSGADLTHLELTGRLWTHPGEIPWDGIDNDGNLLADDVHGYNFHDNHSNPSDASVQSHGTHVAGVMAAAMNNGQGVAGASPASRVMVLRVTDTAGTASTPAILGAIEYAVAMKARGVNVVALNASLAGGVYDFAEAAAIQAAGNAGIVFCCAAGNTGVDNDAVPNYPGNYRLPNMLVAAATDQNKTGNGELPGAGAGFRGYYLGRDRHVDRLWERSGRCGFPPGSEWRHRADRKGRPPRFYG
ncbi:MAG: S8 family serine peptidase [Akkermansiaceae bacterium]|nr:S8 family serine peptidase [Akkermansiaceae bacterium]